MTLPQGLITGKTARLPTDWKKQAKAVGLETPNRYESLFITLWTTMFPQLPAPTAQYRFHDTRKWRLDFAWPDVMLGIEIDGQVHAIRAQRVKDAAKSRALLEDGWYCVHWTSDELKERPIQCVEETAQILKKLLAALTTEIDIVEEEDL